MSNFLKLVYRKVWPLDTTASRLQEILDYITNNEISVSMQDRILGQHSSPQPSTGQQFYGLVELPNKNEIRKVNRKSLSRKCCSKRRKSINDFRLELQ
jgi:hypothetical protein